jgi:AraC-like DNA-binding protein
LAAARISFDALATTIVFPASLLALPLPRPGVDTASVRRPLEAAPSEFVESVRALVSSLLDTGYPGVALAADAAGMTVRTFQRRLGAHGLSYAQLVSDVRLAEASRLLVESDRPVIDIALPLGYSAHAHFTRAFRGWTGMSPMEFRRSYRQRGAAPA